MPRRWPLTRVAVWSSKGRREAQDLVNHPIRHIDAVDVLPCCDASESEVVAPGRISPSDSSSSREKELPQQLQVTTNFGVEPDFRPLLEMSDVF